ncbi:tRNA pseudouridine(38-40) synthase TruA [Alkalibacillus salilacus]|uniref:tRNA pseudouridine synthase A n=1 Tax=Alkalibacillus salilacus TaxID=284582 RepID=A0ABT9VHD2_9BACI|nr:tRNA pseudouridine(38-40) synthase TruA [Alkalibacillus salilacus]MDQ0160373.1 tRNA pseudouridine38-40 synthase [Alkalibacillus salilacus]
MERIKVHIAYDGTHFAGYQVQTNERTVQLVIEQALKKMHREDIRIYSSGRTDSGVHALDQVIHFNTRLTLDCSAWHQALQTLLPSDVQVQRVEKVDEQFHARKSAQGKIYRYVVLNQRHYDLFNRQYEWHVMKQVDVGLMKVAAEKIVGTHDFTPFSASKSNVTGDKTRTVNAIDIWEDNGRIVFEVKGDGFLTHMVRIIVGTLVEIGLNKKESTCIDEAFATLDRQKVGMTAPSHGLFLWQVIY